MGKKYVLRFNETAPRFVNPIVLVTYAKQGIMQLTFKNRIAAEEWSAKEKRRIERNWKHGRKEEPCFAEGFSRQGESFARKEAPMSRSRGMQIRTHPKQYIDAGGPNDTRLAMFRK